MHWQELLELNASRRLVDVSNQEPCDVFLSYNSRDRSQVEAVAKYLKKCGLKPWLDSDQIFVGDDIPSSLQTAMRSAKSAVIFIGKNQLGPHQQKELSFFHMQYAKGDLKIFPVLLPEVASLPREPEYALLESLKNIRLSHEDYERALNELVGSIRRWLSIWATKKMKILLKEKGEAELKLRQIEQEIPENSENLLEMKSKAQLKLRQIEQEILLEMKSEAQFKLHQIEQEINQIASKIEAEVSPQRAEVLDWLSSTQKMSKHLAAMVLGHFPDVEETVKKEKGGFDYFCTDLETCFDLIYYAFKVKNISILDAIASIDLSLLNGCVKPGDASLIYNVFFDILENIIEEEKFDESNTIEIKRILIRLRRKFKIIFG